MNRVKCCLLSVSLWISALACEGTPPSASQVQTTKPDTTREVVVCLQLGTATDFRVIARSRMIASEMFERIGVRLQWSCEQPGLAPGDQSKTFIPIRFTGSTPGDFHPGAFAYALPYARTGTRIYVFYDRLDPIVEDRLVSAGSILGHVLAHEIGHVLEGVARHTNRGLMRGQWNSEDLASMSARFLRFAAEDAELIRQNVAEQHRRRVTAESSRNSDGASKDVD